MRINIQSKWFYLLFTHISTRNEAGHSDNVDQSYISCSNVHENINEWINLFLKLTNSNFRKVNYRTTSCVLVTLYLKLRQSLTPKLAYICKFKQLCTYNHPISCDNTSLDLRYNNKRHFLMIHQMIKFQRKWNLSWYDVSVQLHDSMIFVNL